MGGFLSSLFGGSNPTLNNNISQTGQNASFDTSLGQKNTTAASDFFNAITSGDMSKIGQVLAPQIAGIKGQGEQEKATTAEFFNRSGGNNARMQTTDDRTRGQINDLIGKLTGSAVSGEASLGLGEQGLGEQATRDQTQMSQEQMQNWMHSILGSGITGAFNYGESFLPIAHGG